MFDISLQAPANWPYIPPALLPKVPIVFTSTPLETPLRRLWKCSYGFVTETRLAAYPFRVPTSKGTLAKLPLLYVGNGVNNRKCRELGPIPTLIRVLVGVKQLGPFRAKFVDGNLLFLGMSNPIPLFLRPTNALPNGPKYKLLVTARVNINLGEVINVRAPGPLLVCPVKPWPKEAITEPPWIGLLARCPYRLTYGL